MASHNEHQEDLLGNKQDQSQEGTTTSTTTELVPWKYCNIYANNRSPERLFVFQGHSIFIQQRLDEKVTIDQNTGNVVWDGAYLMSKYLETHVIHDLQGKTCLELGAGTGLVSLVAWLLGASHVLATDLPGPHTEHIQRNTSANTRRIALGQQQQQRIPSNSHRCTGRGRDRLCRTIELNNETLHVAPLDWSSPTLPDTVPYRGPFSYILCSEILYLPQFHRALLKTIAQFSDHQTIVFLLWKQRGLGEERFFEIASRPSSGWDVQFLDKSLLDTEFQDQPYGIARMTRSQV